MTNKQFVEKAAETLGDQFLLSDMIRQEELFEMQDKLAKLICDAYNEGNPLAKHMVKKLPQTFTT